MYQPKKLVIDSLPSLASSVKSEFDRIAIELSQPTDYLALKTLYAQPGRIFDGMIVKADGVTWNPGGGAGVYLRTTSAWVKL